MNASPRSVADIFSPEYRYVVPFFQRQYVWRESSQLALLWEDVEARVEARATGVTRPHFLGALELIDQGEPDAGLTGKDVVDGQQRLTTMQLLMKAFRDQLSAMGVAKEDPILDGLDRLTRNATAHTNSPDGRFKVWPGPADRLVFRSVMAAGSAANVRMRFPGKGKLLPLLVQAYLYFSEQIGNYLRYNEDGGQREGTAGSEAARRLFDALQKDFMFVVIELARDDDPQVIFESLNGRGEPLLPSDLIKNLVLRKALGLRLGGDEWLYGTYWRVFDDEFWTQEVRQGRLMRPRVDLFFFHYLTLRTQKELHIKNLYTAFRDYWEGICREGPDTVKGKMDDILSMASVFRSFYGDRQDDEVGRSLARLRALDTSTIYPVLLWLLGDATKQEKTSRDQMQRMLRAIESYVVRRFLCGQTLQKYNWVFLDLLRKLIPMESINADDVGRVLASHRGPAVCWPSDEDIKKAVVCQATYAPARARGLKMVLATTSQDMCGPKAECRPVNYDDLVLAPILPETDQLWQQMAVPQQFRDLVGPGVADGDLRDRLQNSLGNLTVLTRPLDDKSPDGLFRGRREHIMQAGYGPLNSTLAGLDAWSADAIIGRGRHLSERIARIWPGPNERCPPWTPGGEPHDGNAASNQIGGTMRGVAISQQGEPVAPRPTALTPEIDMAPTTLGAGARTEPRRVGSSVDSDGGQQPDGPVEVGGRSEEESDTFAGHGPKQESVDVLIGKTQVHAESVRELFEKTLTILIEQGCMERLPDGLLPYPTSNKRYLIARSPVHQRGNAFVVCVQVGQFYMEAHKDYERACRQLGDFLSKCDVRFGVLTKRPTATEGTTPRTVPAGAIADVRPIGPSESAQVPSEAGGNQPGRVTGPSPAVAAGLWPALGAHSSLRSEQPRGAAVSASPRTAERLQTNPYRPGCKYHEIIQVLVDSGPLTRCELMQRVSATEHDLDVVLSPREERGPRGGDPRGSRSAQGHLYYAVSDASQRWDVYRRVPWMDPYQRRAPGLVAPAPGSGVLPLAPGGPSPSVPPSTTVAASPPPVSRANERVPPADERSRAPLPGGPTYAPVGSAAASSTVGVAAPGAMGGQGPRSDMVRSSGGGNPPQSTPLWRETRSGRCGWGLFPLDECDAVTPPVNGQGRGDALMRRAQDALMKLNALLEETHLDMQESGPDVARELGMDNQKELLLSARLWLLELLERGLERHLVIDEGDSREMSDFVEAEFSRENEKGMNWLRLRKGVTHSPDEWRDQVRDLFRKCGVRLGSVGVAALKPIPQDPRG